MTNFSPEDQKIFRQIVWPLAIAQTLIWAAIYYAFPALLLAWERDLGWSKTELSGAFTLAVITSALLAPVMGRLIDRDYTLYSFTGSAVLGAVLLILLSRVQVLWQFYAVWILLGVAMSGSLYEACFAVLTRTMGSRARKAITLVTLVAGFAGTVSFPGNNYLVSIMGWRNATLVLAAIVLLVVAPLIWFGCRTALAYGQPQAAITRSTPNIPVAITRNPIFWLLGVGFAALALDHSMLLTHLLPLLNERNVSSGNAIFAASMIGPMQVTGRLLMLAFERRVSSLVIFAVCYVAMAVAAVALFGATFLPALLIIFVFFQGAGAGVTSIMRPVVTAELLGQVNFGVIAGFLAIPYLVAAASGPTIAALIWEVGGYDMVIWMAGIAAIVGLVALLWATHLSAKMVAQTTG